TQYIGSWMLAAEFYRKNGLDLPSQERAMAAAIQDHLDRRTHGKVLLGGTGAIAAGVLSPVALEGARRCVAAPATCDAILTGLVDSLAGDATGGASLVIKAGTAAKVAGAIVERIDGRAANLAGGATGRTSFDALLEATPQMPTASGFINASKVCESGCLLPTVTEAEKKLVESIVKSGDRTGRKTEELIEAIAVREGMTSYSGKYGANKGFDHVLVGKNDEVTIIVDSKQMNNGAFKLGRS